MHSAKKIKILFCYEHHCGGETIATDSIFDQLTTQSQYSLKKHQHEPLKGSSLYHYCKWLCSSYIFFLQKYLLENSNFVIYTTTVTAAIPALPFILLGKAQLIFHYHGSRIPVQAEQAFTYHAATQYLKYSMLNFLQATAFKYSNVIIIPTDETRKLLSKQFPAIPNSKYFVIPNGYDHSQFFPISLSEKHLIRKKLNIDERHAVLLINGRLEPKKNIERALKYIVRKPACILLLTYPKPITSTEQKYVLHLQCYSSKLQVSRQVIMIEDGYNMFKPANLLGAADVICSFSEIENMPLSAIEAIACRVPYFSTNMAVRKLFSNETFRLRTWKSVANQVSLVILRVTQLP